MIAGKLGGPPAVRSDSNGAAMGHRKHRVIDSNVIALNKDDIISAGDVLAAPVEDFAADNEDVATTLGLFLNVVVSFGEAFVSLPSAIDRFH